MLKQVWKFSLSLQDDNVRSMPKGSRTLWFAMQGDTPCLWALVDPTAKTVDRTFCIFGTGHSTYDAEDLVYIGTAFHGPFVWHCFERKQEGGK